MENSFKYLGQQEYERHIELAKRASGFRVSRTDPDRALRSGLNEVKQRRRVNKPKKKKQDGPVVAQLLELKTRAHEALAGSSNDAEHDALYEIEGALAGLTADVRRMVKALKL
jgi:hypothetical protein